jgi:ketosteroid isomerase-like protein
MADEIQQLEERLRRAMLDGDAAALDSLLDDRILFTGPDGGVMIGKADDLDAYRSGRMKVASHEPSELRVERHGDDAAVVSVRVALAGEFRGQPFQGSYRYTRFYLRRGGAWRIVGGGVTPVAA